MSTNFLTAIYNHKFLVFLALFLLGSSGLGQLIRRYDLSWTEVYLAQLLLSIQWLLVANMRAPSCDSCAKSHAATEPDVERSAADGASVAGEKAALARYYHVVSPPETRADEPLPAAEARPDEATPGPHGATTSA